MALHGPDTMFSKFQPVLDTEQLGPRRSNHSQSLHACRLTVCSVQPQMRWRPHTDRDLC